MTRWPLYLVLAATLAMFAWAGGCLRANGNKGVDLSKQQDDHQQASTEQHGDGNRSTTVNVQEGLLGAAGVILGGTGFGLARQSRRRLAALDRCVRGIEECGPECAAKHHVRHAGIVKIGEVRYKDGDATEKLINWRVRKLTKHGIGPRTT